MLSQPKLLCWLTVEVRLITGNDLHSNGPNVSYFVKIREIVIRVVSFVFFSTCHDFSSILDFLAAEWEF